MTEAEKRPRKGAVRAAAEAGAPSSGGEWEGEEEEKEREKERKGFGQKGNRERKGGSGD